MLSAGERIERPLYDVVLPKKAREEDGTLWLWAWPDLLQWPHELVWLFSPVVGRKPYPGDLVGVDEFGTLVFVETKLARRPSDPFQDFVGRAESLRNGNTDRIVDRWERLLRCERAFIRTRLSEVAAGNRFEKAYPGVVPYSSRRFVLGRWPHLYRNQIVPSLLEAGGYEEKARCFLEVRTGTKSKRAAFFALFTVVPPGEPTLTMAGHRNRKELAHEIGKQWVRACAVEAVPMNGSLIARSWTVDLDAG